jgi:cell division initiation protein
MFTPVDLETIVFHRSFRGYNRAEIQDFMEQITRDYEHLYRENIDLKEQLEELDVKLNQYKLIEETLRNAMVMAQETAEEMKKTARDQAEMIVREAQIQGEQAKSRTKEEIQSELRNLALLKNQTEYFRCQFKSFLSGLIELADKQLDIPIDWDKFGKTPPVVSDPGVAVAAALENESYREPQRPIDKTPPSKMPF